MYTISIIVYVTVIMFYSSQKCYLILLSTAEVGEVNNAFNTSTVILLILPFIHKMIENQRALTAYHVC